MKFACGAKRLGSARRDFDRRLTTFSNAKSELMQKEKKTALELADMISEELKIGGTFIKVHPDKVYGWHPTVVATPQNAHALQKAAETIATRFRAKYQLKK
jgi:hypothetical protein